MKLTHLYRHPVKSVGSEQLSEVVLTAGGPMPDDRVFAVAHGASAFDPSSPAWAACENFLRVTHSPLLAAISVAYAPETQRLRATHPEAAALEADLSTAEGRAALAAWVAPFVGAARSGPYTVVEAGGVSLSDAPDQAPTLKSLASLRALSERTGASLDPRRFRGNLWIDGVAGAPLAPFEELEWAGRVLAIGADVRIRIVEPVNRCQATAANPETGQRDAFPLKTLKTEYGHAAFGVLTEVVAGGRIAEGDPVRFAD